MAAYNSYQQRNERRILSFFAAIDLKLSICFIALLLYLPLSSCAETQKIKIGILHSLTGTMAESEKPLIKAAKLAVQEINQAGGLLGKQIEAIVIDGKSDDAVYEKEAERLILEENVSALFGCWKSSCRKRLIPLIEKHDHLLFYPVQYEGFENSPNVIYTGMTANQQLIPALSWARKTYGNRFLLIGSDYIFPKTTNSLIHALTDIIDLNIKSEQYVPLGEKEFTGFLSSFQPEEYDVIINTINGDSNRYFFKHLSRILKNQPQKHFPVVVSLSLDERSLSGLPDLGGRLISAWSYYHNLPSKTNQTFIRNFQSSLKDYKPVTDPMQNIYVSIKLWSQAVTEAGSELPEKVNRAIIYQSYSAPEGVVAVDRNSRHLYHKVRIARHVKGNTTEILWETKYPIRPDPYPLKYSQDNWKRILGN